ncbi:hypothetical protein SAMN05421630_1011296 [Prauserella marina]|uniref:Uncharacterized protein n=2 Tax=Prauserella marina TaxID=530584 RepID=A0A1G6KMS8_9PSEU|nr:hypothetical protein DES30_10141 [Prauserella marina]SDC32217.1 hypothetical protein SAMN05421630_1011296 [Prauserella marina]
MTYPPQHDMPGWRGEPGHGARSGTYGGAGVPPRPPKRGLLIGIVSAALVAVVAVGVVFYVTRDGGSGDDGAPVAQGRGGFEISADEPESPEQPGDDTPDSHRGGTWRYIDDLCDRVTIDPYVSGMSEASPRLDFDFELGSGQGSMGCVLNYRGEGRSVVLSVAIWVGSTPEKAKATYEKNIEYYYQDDPVETVLPGDWDQSVVRTGGGISETSVNSAVLLEHVTAYVHVGGSGLPYTEAEIPGMALRTIEEMLELTSV